MATLTETKTNNVHPSSNQISKRVQLFTYDGSDPDNKIPIKETYSVRATGNFATNMQRIWGTEDEIYVFPIPNSNYGVKFYYPRKNDDNYYDKVYMTLCVKNDSYASGWQDYTTTIPTDYATKFKAWANTLPKNVVQQGATTPYASDNYKTKNPASVSQAVQFGFSFNGNQSKVMAGEFFSFSIEFSSGVSK